MNPIILVCSCKRDVQNGSQQAQRDTCFSQSAIPYKFVLGYGNIVKSKDEIVVDALDSYDWCSGKMREGYRWALENGYDYIFKADVDTYCFTDRLLTSGFEKYDYVGRFVDNLAPDWLVSVDQHKSVKLNDNHVRASGGCGYWLSKLAAEKLVLAETKPQSPEWVYEDWYTGWVLAQAGIQGTQDYRYHPGPDDACARLSHKQIEPFLDNLCTVHLSASTGVYDKSRMYAVHSGKQVYDL